MAQQMSKSSTNSKSAAALVNICLSEGHGYALTVICDEWESENATVKIWQATTVRKKDFTLLEITFATYHFSVGVLMHP